MKLLITTQAIDKNDPILGFFHGWVLEFAKHFERIDIICLRKGTYELPPHVHVHSLGKEEGVNYLKYIIRFFSYIWKLRKEYDVVFSHMNPHYIVLGGWFWMLLRKRIYFWRNHAKMNLMTRIAALYARKVFYTSPFACTRIFSHAVQMPVGIDTHMFKEYEEVNRKMNSVLFLGRLSPVKRPELFIETCTLIPDHDVHVFGDESSGKHGYRKKLEQMASHNVHFHNAIPNYETPRIYSSYEIYINLTPEGSMDKTILEAAACGALVLVSNKSFNESLPFRCILGDVTKEGIANSIRGLSQLSEDQKEEIRKEAYTMVCDRHSLQKLATELLKYFHE